MEYLRIQSKDDLREWLQYERTLYFGGGGETSNRKRLYWC